MQSLELLDEHKAMHRPKFLERNFSQAPTRRQLRFDWTFGVILPIVCIAADPIVFRSSLGLPDRDMLFFKYKVFAYVLSSVSILAMTAWLLWGDRLGDLRPFLGGLFLVAGAISTLVGLCLFPFSMMGLILLIGVLGFTPLFSGFVYLRNAGRAIYSATDDMPKRYVIRAAVLAALYALAVPIVLNYL